MGNDKHSNEEKKHKDGKQVIPKRHYKRKRRAFFHNEEREKRVQKEREAKEREKEREAKLAKNNEERVKDNLRKARIEKLTQEEIQHQKQKAHENQEDDSPSETLHSVPSENKKDKSEFDTANQSKQRDEDKKEAAVGGVAGIQSEKASKKEVDNSMEKDNKEKEKSKSDTKEKEAVAEKPSHQNDKHDTPSTHTPDKTDTRNHSGVSEFLRRNWAKIAVVIGAIILVLLLFAIFHNLQDRDNSSSGQVSSFNGSGDKKQTAMMKAAKETTHSVVTVENKDSNKGSVEKEAPKSDGEIGSGVVYKKVGDSIFILTNAHVVGDKANQNILYDDKQKTNGKVIGKDKYSDIAVVKAEVDKDSKVKPIAIGDSNQLQLAEPIITVGNPLGADFKGSVSNGIISGLNRNVPVDIDKDGSYDNLTKAFQIDAPVNPGNSGGAVVDQNGKLIGIVSLKIDMQAVEGMAFAIPVNHALDLAKQLEKHGHIDYPNTGVQISNVSDLDDGERHQMKLPDSVEQGAVVRAVKDNSIAEKAGLKSDDVIVELGGTKIEDSLRYRQIIFEHKDDKKSLSAKIYRNGKLKDINIKLK
ncbi:S1C family serine protease [Staphylococcus debuckii]|uniref:Serine protease HtrA-like n=1 Tax=Staphylococcus debuckii TaxID=2044912 RepID=A0ABU9EY08_9STAP